MATVDKIHISPSINFTETDLTFAARNFGLTGLGVVGEFQKGRAFTPILVNDYSTMKTLFGGLNPCKYRGSQQLKYEGGYIAKEFLSESDRLYVTRVLGLSGYDAGDAWVITTGGALDDESVSITDTDTFICAVRWNNGSVEKVDFTDPVLQDLYDNGLISTDSLGTFEFTTGDTASLTNTFLGDCETFTGARYSMQVFETQENFLCITGVTTSATTTTTSGITQSCVVEYSAGTITVNSIFFIQVVNPIVVVNDTTNALYVVQSGLLQLVGGTITHTDTGLQIVGGTIYFPNGDVFTGGSYSICDINNNAFYDCNTISGTGYTIVTGTTTIFTPVTVTGSTQVITKIPTGIKTIVFSGEVVHLSGSPLAEYDNTAVLTLRSNARYTADEIVNFQVQGDVLSIESLTPNKPIRPYDDFVLKGTDRTGAAFSYVVSLDPQKPNFLPKVFGSFVQCCESNSQLMVEEFYQSALARMVANNQVYCIKPKLCYVQNLDNFKQEYRGAVTPYIVSELRGSKVLRLFRFHTFSEGDASNREIKISIENISLDNKTFDVVVRAYDDLDRSPVVLEAWRRLTLQVSNNNFIGRAIGTVDGEFSLNSKYIMVELVRECVEDAVPAGFEGYPIRDYGCAQAPEIQYQTEYSNTISPREVRQNYLGLSSSFGYDQDMFDYKGKPNVEGLNYWTGSTLGFHLDIQASAVTVDTGASLIDLKFATGNAEFKSESGVFGTDYERLVARKFTLAPYGGFDGWDIYRYTRTNTDTYRANGAKGALGTVTGVFSPVAFTDGTIGITSDFYAYLKGIRTLSNKETVRINLIATPGINTIDHSNLVEETIDMVETERCDCFYVCTTPDTTDDGSSVLTPEDIAATFRDLYDSSYTATYWSWGQYFDTENNRFVWIPATANVMRSFAFTDKRAKTWFAAAGTTRGITTFKKARYEPTLDERDVLYEAKLNPLATLKNINANGDVFIWGNRTMQKGDSALSDINVRRLVLYLRQAIADVSVNLLFEQNDEQVRRQFENAINPILSSVQADRGIQQFRIQLDRSAEAFASRTLTGKIVIIPTRPLETINIGFTLTDTQAEFDNV